MDFARLRSFASLTRSAGRRGWQFEAFVAELLRSDERLGLTEVEAPMCLRASGIDLLARDRDGGRWAVQVKAYGSKRAIGVEAVRWVVDDMIAPERLLTVRVAREHGRLVDEPRTLAPEREEELKRLLATIPHGFTRRVLISTTERLICGARMQLERARALGAPVDVFGPSWLLSLRPPKWPRAQRLVSGQWQVDDKGNPTKRWAPRDDPFRPLGARAAIELWPWLEGRP